MSEKEKKRRDLYRKKREKLIVLQSLIMIVLAVAIIVSSVVSIQLKKKYYIHYTERGNIDYNVFLKENEFYEESYLGQGQSYVASLIDRIIANFNYRIDMDSKDVNYRYSYKISSTLEIIDDLSNVAIFNPEYELVSEQNKSHNSSERLEINEIVVINYDEYNSLASRFLETYDLSSTTSNIVVKLEVDVLSDCDAFSGSAVETYTSELRIPLTTKTVNIKMTSTIPAEEARMIACTRGAGSEVFATTAIVLGVIEGLLIAILVAFIYLTRTADITYTARVKKIVSQYKSYIQRINNLFETAGYQVIWVNTFDEMLEIRDTIQAPILMHENEDKTCCKFIIPTDGKLLYVYAISVEGYEEPQPAPVAEPAHTTNITNVVRPVVKVVLNPTPAAPTEPEAVIETILEEPDVEADEAIEVVATTEELVEPEEIEEVQEPEIVEEVEKQDSETEELLSSIPVVDEPEDGSVEAIDVFWKERPGKTYRYDPNGNEVEDGDIVLVPTRDELNNRDVIREAEVARGNYRIDPSSLDRPLKKIIGVVKRKAEKLFVAMVTPTEEDLEKDLGKDPK